MRDIVPIGLLVLMTVLLAQGEEAQQGNGHHNSRSTRLRHLRHLGDRHNTPVAEALRSSSSRNSPNTVSSGDGYRLTIRDNHKPVFTNCSLYRPSFKEEEPSGTFVTQVRAVDRDPPDAGGTVTYSFVLSKSEQKKFNIDPNTGIITTNHMFDRDEPMREKEVYLTVRATDNGLPQLDDVCTFKVIIVDINDNSPVFDKVYYVESVPQDLAPKREVMRISASDLDDGNNSIVQYDLEGFPSYFRIDRSTGIIYLEKPIDKEPGFQFRLNATATDQGEEHNNAGIFLEIRVIESHKKPPTFIDVHPPYEPIRLLENRTSYQEPVVTLTAASNIVDEPELQFVLVTGRTEQTNKLNTFVMESNGSRASIKQGKALDFETVSEYTLTIRVQNKFNLATERQIQIRLEDVNDNIPYFTEVVSGSVLENEVPGTPVMQVRAFDSDGTTQHNQVTYELGDNFDLFQIDPTTGNITTLKQFDREEKDFYNVKVYAKDNSPSAIYNNGLPNRGEQVFSIEIADKNDNPPHFTQKVYVAESIAEDANNNQVVIEVKALDNDTASPVKYSIIEGNTYDAFAIESLTGKIIVNNQLDYENITSYSLKVRAFDGVYEDFAKVEIKIENVNDNPPEFMPYDKNITIKEEEKTLGCIVRMEAYDPDIPDRSADQRIVYFVVKEDQRRVLTIDKEGCLSLMKPLDRDPPHGYPTWQVLVGAKDEDGNSPTSHTKTTEVLINLIDINDNAPFLDMPHPVVWMENQPPGNITKLTAKDYDSDENGPPFIFKIDANADEDIKTKFEIRQTDLLAKVVFDRESQKVYYIPIAITDNGIPRMTGTSTLTVIIGDENDNEMKSGSSSIFVYNYQGEAPNTDIGRVYVDDADDWDLPDKRFRWKYGEHPNFSLDPDTGMITMLYGTNNNSFLLEFTVTEESKLITLHSVDATVNVTVKEIPEEAVQKSGSIRFSGISAEEFVAPATDGGPSKQQLLANHLASILNTSIENVDVFTVLHSPNRNSSRNLLDVRFSAHGSPYYYPEKLNRLTTEHQDALEHELGASMLMINIDECILENDLCNSSSCTNFLNIQNKPYVVYTNTSSFVGVSAVVDPLCTCNSKDPLVCLNGGTPVGETCECMEGYEGPHCEVLGIGFYGEGWALYPPLQACEESHLSLELTTNKATGLVFYVGPMRKNPNQDVQDFMSLELQKGYPVLLVDYGTGTVKEEQTAINLHDGKPHRLDIIWTKTGIELKVDNCQKSVCFLLRTPEGANEFLNVNGPLQVGGSAIDLTRLGNQMNWTHKPTDVGFSGCIRNLTYNAKTYNLGMPSDSKNADPGCSRAIATAVSFGIDTNFLVAILVCIAILLILLLAVVVHRRKTDDMYKDMDDIRENIITYEDEGGGEIDAGFDMNVLRMYDSDGQPMLSKPIMKDHLQTGADEVPDICGFLDGKKKICDNDPETNPFDDVRHYAYEGDGNTTGSLSSLASGTDEGDLNFDYLSNFGPRFRKLADMYGEDPSDDDDNFNNPASESWC